MYIHVDKRHALYGKEAGLHLRCCCRVVCRWNSRTLAQQPHISNLEMPRSELLRHRATSKLSAAHIHPMSMGFVQTTRP